MATAATAGKGALKRCHHPLKMETPTVMSAKRAKKSASKARSFGTLNQAIRFMVGKLKKVASRRDKYHSTDGTTPSVVVRFDGKDDDKEFIPFHPTASGWAIGDPPGEWPLFHLAKLLAPDFNPSSEPVFIPEGEKCVVACAPLGTRDYQLAWLRIGAQNRLGSDGWSARCDPAGQRQARGRLCAERRGAAVTVIATGHG